MGRGNPSHEKSVVELRQGIAKDKKATEPSKSSAAIAKEIMSISLEHVKVLVELEMMTSLIVSHASALFTFLFYVMAWIDESLSLLREDLVLNKEWILPSSIASNLEIKKCHEHSFKSRKNEGNSCQIYYLHEEPIGDL